MNTMVWVLAYPNGGRYLWALHDRSLLVIVADPDDDGKVWQVSHGTVGEAIQMAVDRVEDAEQVGGGTLERAPFQINLPEESTREIAPDPQGWWLPCPHLYTDLRQVLS